MDDYNRKIDEFINANNFTKLPRKGINKCRNIIKKNNNKWKHVNMNPSAPRLHDPVKLHMPVQSTVNWRNCPTYKVANT
jgi:hypothetical protein